MSIVCTIPYSPRYPHVHEIIEKHRFTVLVAHRRFGKTVLSINHLLKAAICCERELGSFCYLAPLRNQAKLVAWAYLKTYAAGIPDIRINESELSVALPNGATIRIAGADNPDALRGLYFDGIILDEVATMKAEVWTAVIQPALSDRKGWAVFIGTPKGINLFSELYYYALQKMAEATSEDASEWYALSFPITATSVIPADEVARLKRELSDIEFRQEELCDFTASDENTLISIDLVKMAMARELDPMLQQAYPIVIGVDVARFGKDNTVFVKRQGLYVWPPIVLHGLNNVEVSHRLVAYIAETKAEFVFIDQGQGTGVIDLVRDLTAAHDVRIVEIPFGSRAVDAERYANKRAEMWDKVRLWLEAGGKLPDSDLLLAELTAPTYSFDMAGRIKLEEKEKIKERLKRSTDIADAIALAVHQSFPASKKNFLPELDDIYGIDSAEKIRKEMLGASYGISDERENVWQW